MYLSGGDERKYRIKTISFLDAIASLLLAGSVCMYVCMYVTIWLKTHQFHSFSSERLGNGKWDMGNGKEKMENGKWKMENGKWKMGNG